MAKKSTEIINTVGDRFHYDLTNYPQTPPVLPSDIYDKLFNQVNGLKRSVWTNPTNKAYGPANIEYIDALFNKTYYCNAISVEKTKGKKVMVDEDFTTYYVDDIGDKISCNRYNFHFTTNKERDTIVSVLQYLLDNNYKKLFGNRSSNCHTYIPGIRIND